MSNCADPMYTCPAWETVTLVSGKDFKSELGVTVDRTVSLTLGRPLVLQRRERLFQYSDRDMYQLSGVKALVEAGGWYQTCYGSVDTDFSATFSDVYTTLDTELLYLDLRYDVVVTKEITDVMTATDAHRDEMPGTSVRVFTGYETVSFHPVMFSTIPIERTVTHNLYIGGSKTELHSESVHRGSDSAMLLMQSFPTSAFGITILTEWAQEIDWYRSDLNIAADGDRLLFWAPWHRQCGDMNQVLDQFNRNLIADYDSTQSNVTSEFGQNPGMNQAKLFRGSVAFDAARNMFYSIAVPDTIMSTTPGYVRRQKLVINNMMVPIPTDAESDVWFPIAPL